MTNVSTRNLYLDRNSNLKVKMGSKAWKVGIITMMKCEGYGTILTTYNL